MTVEISIKAAVDRSEQGAVSEAVGLLEGTLRAAAEAKVAVHCQFEDTPEALLTSSGVNISIVSFLPEVSKYRLPWAEVEARLSDLCSELTAKSSSTFLCTVFRYVAASEIDAPSKLTRIRRLNLLAAELSRATGAFVIDLDRCLSDIGAVKLQTDYKLTGSYAKTVFAREVASALVSTALDEYFPVEVQDAAKLSIGQIDLGLPTLRPTATDAAPSNVLALGAGRRKQVVATVVDVDEESHVGWLFHLLLTGKLSFREAMAKLSRSIARRGLRASSAMVFTAIWQLLSRRRQMGR
jgi:hypothetical protein